MSSENSDRIRQALTYIRTTGEIKYLTGDNLYYKREAFENGMVLQKH